MSTLHMIDTLDQIKGLVDLIYFKHMTANQLTAFPSASNPILYVDLEGIKLSRTGSISILTLLINVDSPPKLKAFCLVDVCVLGASAFNTPGSNGKTLKDILEDKEIVKVFFDVRNDSDALFAHYGVAMQGIEDVQLMENACREIACERIRVNGLNKCIGSLLEVLYQPLDRMQWEASKKLGGQLFDPKFGGSYQVFNERPLDPQIINYCTGDVQFLPQLRERLLEGKSEEWKAIVRNKSEARVAESQSPGYEPHGPLKPLVQWSEEEDRMLDEYHIAVARSRYEVY